ncbi:MAG TPA: YCF48-related protein [Puia sp.]|nr:YCF48-related protein [Puia sp.]
MLRPYLVLLGIVFFCACSKPDNPTPTPPSPPINDSVPVKPPPSIDTAHWKMINTGINTVLLDIWFTDSLHGVLTGADSMLYRSVDGGQTWKPSINSKSDLQCLYFLNAKQGYAAGINNFAYTLDGGQTWTVKAISGTLIDTIRSAPYSFPWPNLQFVSGSNGYLTTGKGLYKTTDTGTTWTIVNTQPVHAMYFTSANTGYVYYPYNSCSKTIDGSQTWQPPVTLLAQPGADPAGVGLNPALNLLQFTDDLHGWYLDGFVVAGTTDGGQTWNTLHQFQSQGYADIQMLSNQLGYLCGKTIMKTTDGGTNWLTDLDLGGGYAASIFMLDANHGWACGASGMVFKYGIQK